MSAKHLAMVAAGHGCFLYPRIFSQFDVLLDNCNLCVTLFAQGNY